MPVRIGVIGAGMIGCDHARRISQTLTGGQIVAVNDVNSANAKNLNDELGLGASIYENGHDLIQSDSVDAVLVTSWGPTHEEFVLSAISAGKYVFCEKPLATSAAACRRIVDAELKAGKRLVQVGFMRRYDKGYKLLKESIERGEVGEPLILHCAHRNPEVGENYGTAMAAEDSVVHELDVVRWLLSDDYISAQVVFPRSTRHAHAKLKDPQIFLFETTRGVRIDVEMFVNCRYGYDIQCTLVGEEGVASLPEPLSLLRRKEACLYSDVLTNWKLRFVDAYDAELQEFINGVSQGKIQGPSTWDGYAAAVASDACLAAQQSGKIEPIDMPEKPAAFC